MTVMNPITTTELTQIQADVAAAALSLSCTVQRKSRTSDGMGGFTESWSTVATVNAGISQPSASQLQNYDYLIGSLATWQVRLPYGTDVRIADQLTIAGLTLTVQVPLSPNSYSALLTVLASKVR